VVGNKTEGAMLILSQEMGLDYTKYRKALVVGNMPDGAIQHKFDFSSERKRMSIVLKANEFSNNAKIQLDDNLIVLSKGASEIMLERCSKIMLENGQIVLLAQEMKADIT
jgi:magnesium-transporting ATPase (P-type)